MTPQFDLLALGMQQPRRPETPASRLRAFVAPNSFAWLLMPQESNAPATFQCGSPRARN